MGTYAPAKAQAGWGVPSFKTSARCLCLGSTAWWCCPSNQARDLNPRRKIVSFWKSAMLSYTGPKHLTFYEFFAGGGMARAGLGKHWTCLFANDIDEMKAATYADNWKHQPLCADIASVRTRDLPGIADLAWASFPCQDLSLAGDGRGIGHHSDKVLTRSGTFWPFWQLIRGAGPRPKRGGRSRP